MYTHLFLNKEGDANFSTHNKSFGLGLTDFNEEHRRIVYILKDIIVFF